MTEPDQQPALSPVDEVRKHFAECAARLTAEVEPATIYVLVPRSAAHTDDEEAGE
jgi:hypothetical protein